MYCTKCGTKNDEGKEFCKNCGAMMNSGKSGINVSIPETITIDTSVIQKLSKYQKMYYGGGLLVLLGSFLPWGSAMGRSVSIMSFGPFSLVTFLYILPLIALGYLFYREVMLKKTITVYYKSSLLAAFCLTTYSLTFYAFIVASQMQSMMGFVTGGFMSGSFGMGIGLILAFVGSSLVTFGILLSIREQTR